MTTEEKTNAYRDRLADKTSQLEGQAWLIAFTYFNNGFDVALELGKAIGTEKTLLTLTRHANVYWGNSVAKELKKLYEQEREHIEEMLKGRE